MKASKIVALALAVLGLGAAPAMAASVDYFLDVPLFSSTDSGAEPDVTLRGTLSYDGDEAMTGTFAFGGNPSETFAGLTFLMNLGTDAAPSTGILFDGTSEGGSSLYMNFATGISDAASGMVNYCSTSGCSMFTTAAASLVPAGPSPTGPSPIGLPVGSVSPVPLPPAVSLFGGALAILAIGAMAHRRATPRVQAVQA